MIVFKTAWKKTLHCHRDLTCTTSVNIISYPAHKYSSKNTCNGIINNQVRKGIRKKKGSKNGREEKVSAELRKQERNVQKLKKEGTDYNLK
jgi:hypothetical protein